MQENIQKNKQPFENIEEFPCDIIDLKEFEEETKDHKNFLSVEVEVFLGKDLGEEFQESIQKLHNAFVARTTKRGTRFYSGHIDYDKETGIISFNSGTAIPDYTLETLSYKEKIIGTTFADFCFLAADGTTKFNKDQCNTPFKEDVRPADLTWVLPARFVDDMVEMMSIMNNLVLMGTMEEAILYGPKLYK